MDTSTSQLYTHLTRTAVTQPTHLTPTAVTQPTHLTPTAVTQPTHLTPTAVTHLTPTTQDYVVVPSASSTLAEMLSNIDALDVIPKLQVETYTESPVKEGCVASQSETTPIELPVQQATPITIATIADPSLVMGEDNKEEEGGKKKGRPGRPRTKPQKEKADWHYHLGGMRQARTPLTPEIREVLEVAYVSKILSKNLRKEGLPEKERIAKVTGLSHAKVQEWFKNRRKKDKLLKERQQKKQVTEEATKPTDLDKLEYPITIEAVENTEEWFKNRQRAPKQMSTQEQDSSYDYPLTVVPFLEVHQSGAEPNTLATNTTGPTLQLTTPTSTDLNL